MKHREKALVVVALVLSLLLAGCAGMQPVPPKPECKDAVIVNSEFAGYGALAVRLVFAGVIAAKPEVRGILLLAAQEGLKAVEAGNLHDMAMLIAAELTKFKETQKYAPIAVAALLGLDNLEIKELHVCDKEFLCKLMKDLIILAS